MVRGSVISAISLRQWKHFLFEGHPTPLNSCVVRVFQCFVNGGAWGALCFKRKRWNAVLHIWSCSLFNKILLSWQLWVFIRISIICVGRPCLYKIFGSVGCLSSDCTWWFLAMPVNFAAGNCPGNVHVGLWAGHPGVECCVPKCPKHCAPDQSTPSAGLPNGHNMPEFIRTQHMQLDWAYCQCTENPWESKVPEGFSNHLSPWGSSADWDFGRIEAGNWKIQTRLVQIKEQLVRCVNH